MLRVVLLTSTAVQRVVNDVYVASILLVLDLFLSPVAMLRIMGSATIQPTDCFSDRRCHFKWISSTCGGLWNVFLSVHLYYQKPAVAIATDFSEF